MSKAVKSAPNFAGKRALLAERLRQSANRSFPPLSFAQQRLWFLDQLEPHSPLYNIATLARLLGPLNVSALEKAFNAVIARHEALRTRVICPEDTALQFIDAEVNLQLRVVDLTNLTKAKRDAEAERFIRKEVSRPFDLSTDSLVRATLLRRTLEEHQLILILHHIVADEWSLKILFGELSSFYKGFVQGPPAILPELPIQYADYAVWQQ